MVCSLCRGPNHNRRTCPQRGLSQAAWSAPGSRSVIVEDSRSTDNILRIRKRWKKTIRKIISVRRFIWAVYYHSESVNCSLPLTSRCDDFMAVFYTWGLAKKVIEQNFIKPQVISSIIAVICSSDADYLFLKIESLRRECISYYGARVIPEKDTSRQIQLINMRKENYIVYWVIANFMIEDIDDKENNIKYIGFLPKMGRLKLKATDGHRLYLVPHKLDITPPYHPRTDKEFFIEPYLQLNIHDGIQEKIYLDEGAQLSELNQWKFSALKLDYLIKEMVKLGAKNNDMLESVLDLHEDIQLLEVSELEKDRAGIPSALTNIT